MAGNPTKRVCLCAASTREKVSCWRIDGISPCLSHVDEKSFVLSNAFDETWYTHSFPVLDQYVRGLSETG